MTLLELRNPIQQYDWGSRTAIPELLGRSPAVEPEAELWMGAHPKAPSQVFWRGAWRQLDEVIAHDPEALLGRSVARAYGPRLPFLLKVLAAERPLSIQAHPDRLQARDGFAREEATGLDRWAETRNYRDPHHKPEVLVALTDFTILRGFRPLDSVKALLGRAGIDLPTASLRELFAAFLAIEPGAPMLAAVEAWDIDDPEPAFAWCRRLAEAFPGDRGVLAPLLLHVIQLTPGQAVYTGPGILHAYLGGVGVELMASSDNVLRGACTSKHVDPTELVRIVRFEAVDPLPVDAVECGNERHFVTPADEFDLTRCSASAERAYQRHREASASVEILLVTEGAGVVHAAGEAEAQRFARGQAFLVPGGSGGYRVEGDVTWFRAQVARCPDDTEVESGAGREL